jgi:hypothetical protein
LPQASRARRLPEPGARQSLHEQGLPARHRLRHAERARPDLRPARPPGGQGAGGDRQLPVAAAGLGGERSGAVLDLPVRGLPAPLGQHAGAEIIDCRRLHHHPASHRSQPRPPWPALAPGHRLARPAPRRRRPEAGLVVGSGIARGPHAQHRPLFFARSGSQLDRAAPALALGAHRQIPAAVRLPELSPDRSLRRFRRQPGRLHTLRLPPRPLGRGLELEMAMPAAPARHAAGTGGGRHTARWRKPRRRAIRAYPKACR